MMYVILFAGILNIFLGFITFKYGNRSKSIYSFAAFCLLTGIWVICNFLEYFFGYDIFVKLAYALGLVVTACLFSWSYFYASKGQNKILIPYLVYLIGIVLFFVTAFTKLIVVDVQSISASGVNIVQGSWFFVWAVVTLVTYVGSILLLTKKYFSKNTLDRKKDLKIILGLLGFGMFSMLVSVILPIFGIMNFTNLDSPSSIIFVVLTFVAIVKNQSFGIKVFLVQILAVVIVSISLMEVFYSRNVSELILRLLFFCTISVVSILLVRNVMLEISRKEELEIANAQLKQLDEAKSEFISIASHQLRTPLTTSNGFLSMLFEGSYGEIPVSLQDPLGRVRKANKHLLDLVEDLLNISRIESGRLVFEFTDVKIEDLLKEIVESFELPAKEKQIKLSLVLPKKTLPFVSIDRGKVCEAISNLIDNSIKYTQKGSVKVTCEFRGGNVRVIVSDTGIGVKKEDIENVFGKFSRGSDQKRLTSTGTGLGLYFGKKVIEANHGRIWVESDGIGLGSRFIIEIPVNHAV